MLLRTKRHEKKFKVIRFVYRRFKCRQIVFFELQEKSAYKERGRSLLIILEHYSDSLHKSTKIKREIKQSFKETILFLKNLEIFGNESFFFSFPVALVER